MNTEPTGLELVPWKPCFPHEEVTPPCDSETVSLSGVTFATETTMQETQPNNG